MTSETNSTTAPNLRSGSIRPLSNSTSSGLAAPTKSDTMIKLLSRAKGATSAELIAATGWQSHSVRAFLSGLRKAGRQVVREARKNGEMGYRIVAVAAANAADAAVAAPTADTATA